MKMRALKSKTDSNTEARAALMRPSDSIAPVEVRFKAVRRLLELSNLLTLLKF